MNNPLVSIIIPLYNAEKYIEETIASALSQTWQNKEIIIVDDGSTDDSFAIAKKFESSSVRIIAQKNTGASAARNRGLAEAKGDIIQFLDADDLLSADKIATQIKLLQTRPNHVALCCTMHFADGGDHLSYAADHGWMAAGTDDPVDFLIKLYGGRLIGDGYGGMVQPNAWLTPMQLIKKAGPWNETLTVDDDGEFFCRVLLAGKGIVYAMDGINYYRKFSKEHSWSGGKTHKSMQSSLEADLLKVQHLTSATTDPRAKLALSRLLRENMFNLYPEYKDLAAKAEKEAKALAPKLSYNPYQHGLNLFLSNILGWKTVKYLQAIKQKYFNPSHHAGQA